MDWTVHRNFIVIDGLNRTPTFYLDSWIEPYTDILTWLMDGTDFYRDWWMLDLADLGPVSKWKRVQQRTQIWLLWSGGGWWGGGEFVAGISIWPCWPCQADVPVEDNADRPHLLLCSRLFLSAVHGPGHASHLRRSHRSSIFLAWNFRQKNNSAKDGIDETNNLFRRNFGCSADRLFAKILNQEH